VNSTHVNYANNGKRDFKLQNNKCNNSFYNEVFLFILILIFCLIIVEIFKLKIFGGKYVQQIKSLIFQKIISDCKKPVEQR